MSVVVTGAAGFIGSHLVDRLLADGETVTGLDTRPATDPNLSQAIGHSRYSHSLGDITKPSVIDLAFRPKPSVCYHLASVVGVPRYMSNPLGVIDTVILGTRNVATACRRYGVRLVHLSTSEVYGRNPATPWTETSDRVLGPTNVERWSYSASKAVAEHILYAMEGLKFTILRPFNVYGPRQQPIYAVSQMVHAALNGKWLEVHNNGHQTRSFTYIEDVVEAIVRAGTSDAAIGEVFNIGGVVETAICELADKIMVLADVRTGIEYIGLKGRYGPNFEDIERRVPDCSKAERLLGWKATTDLTDGLKATIAWPGWKLSEKAA